MFGLASAGHGLLGLKSGRRVRESLASSCSAAELMLMSGGEKACVKRTVQHLLAVVMAGMALWSQLSGEVPLKIFNDMISTQ